MNLDDLRRLNIRDVGNWPLWPKVGVLAILFLVIVAAGAYFDWMDQYEALAKVEAEEQTLREQYAEKKNKAINYDLYRIDQPGLPGQIPARLRHRAKALDVSLGVGRVLVCDLHPLTALNHAAPSSLARSFAAPR